MGDEVRKSGAARRGQQGDVRVVAAGWRRQGGGRVAAGSDTGAALFFCSCHVLL